MKSGKTYSGKVRNGGGGAKNVKEKYPEIEAQICKIVDGTTYGNPERVLSYTTESLRKIECELKAQGIEISYRTVILIKGKY